MNTETHRQLAGDIWSICNLLRGPYKRNEYRKVILPLTVLRRFDCLLAPTKAQALATFNAFKDKSENIIRSKMEAATGYAFRAIMERFAFAQQIAKMAEKNLLFKVIQTSKLGVAP